MYVSERLVGEMVDTIFEIGGQDSKFISIDNGVVVDFAMNEACAAGTGSFLEEQAEKLGVAIKDEFASLALQAEQPVRLGERCTVFMERDVTGVMHRGGASKQDTLAGLAYSIVLNYLNRVVRGRKIGEVIFFQGGTAYNDAVAAAFSQVLGKRIIVPPYNGVIGAIGMALIARERYHATGQASRFYGYDLSRVRFTMREFVCKDPACSNVCDMKEVTIEGRKTYWGDQCSWKFRKPTRTDRKPVIDDLFELRRKLLEEFCAPQVAQPVRGELGVPRRHGPARRGVRHRGHHLAEPLAEDRVRDVHFRQAARLRGREGRGGERLALPGGRRARRAGLCRHVPGHAERAVRGAPAAGDLP